VGEQAMDTIGRAASKHHTVKILRVGQDWEEYEPYSLVNRRGVPTLFCREAQTRFRKMVAIPVSDIRDAYSTGVTFYPIYTVELHAPAEIEA